MPCVLLLVRETEFTRFAETTQKRIRKRLRKKTLDIPAMTTVEHLLASCITS
jgi:hypothetical protein